MLFTIQKGTSIFPCWLNENAIISKLAELIKFSIVAELVLWARDSPPSQFSYIFRTINELTHKNTSFWSLLAFSMKHIILETALICVLIATEFTVLAISKIVD